MDLPKNAFKAAIAKGQNQIGVWCSLNDPMTVEMVGTCGFDWMVLDLEHSPMELTHVLPLLQALAPWPVSPVVRPRALDAAIIKKLLDFGAQTILVPYVQTKDEAELAVASVQYAPDGIRGVAGITRAARYGLVENYHKRAREEICLLIQIESMEGVKNLDAILSVPGIDGIFIGPADLAASMGYPGEGSHPEVRRMCVDLAKRIRAAGVPVGFLSLDASFVREMMDAGSVFTAVDIDSAMLRRTAIASARDWKAEAEKR